MFMMQSESTNASTDCIIALLGTWFTDTANGSFARKITLGNSQSGNPHFGTGLAAKKIGRIQVGHSGVPSYSCLQATRFVTSTCAPTTPEWRLRKFHKHANKLMDRHGTIIHRLKILCIISIMFGKIQY